MILAAFYGRKFALDIPIIKDEREQWVIFFGIKKNTFNIF